MAEEYRAGVHTHLRVQMKITCFLLPQNNGDLILPFFVIITLLLSCIIFNNDCICILTGLSK